MFLFILYIANYAKQPSDGVLMSTSLNVLYFVLFIIGFIISNSESNEKILTPVYIAFGVSILLVIGITLYDKHKKNDKIDGIAITNLIFPGLVQTSYAVNNVLFGLGFILLYLVISFLRLANQFKSDMDQAFSPIVLLGSYCFLQVLNYLVSKWQENANISNTQPQETSPDN